MAWRSIRRLTLALLGVLPGTVDHAAALGTAVTYQGRLQQGGTPRTGPCDFQFSLFDAAVAGMQVGVTLGQNNLPVTTGLFTTQLDFGAAFTGSDRWLQIAVRCPAGSGTFTTLSPRQQLTAAPHALFADTIANDAVTGAKVLDLSLGTPDLANGAVTDAKVASGIAYSKLSGAPWVTSGNNLSYDAGNVGIGTPSPSAALSVVTGGATQPIVLGYPTGLKVGTPAGTVPLALRQNAAESETPTLAYFETASGALGFLSAEPSTFVIGAASTMALKVNNTRTAMTINPNGNVGIGTTTPLLPLHIRGPNVSDDEILMVENSVGARGLTVFADRQVQIGTLAPGGSTTHACLNGGLIFTGCSSAAEYVPSVDGGLGVPETADLVSIAPAVSNPYGDTHGPFVVQKSAAPCDPNLLGFIVRPESGADGVKRNEHYLPLAIYGYFPVKVTLENGAIRRGDALTSSSKPGYAMKATRACKTIGYALEDADQEGTIQVFAQHGEHAAAEVASLRGLVAGLQQQNDALAARLDALERGEAPLQSGPLPRDALPWGPLAVAGVVLARRFKR